jgi:hypothetical protein
MFLTYFVYPRWGERNPISNGELTAVGCSVLLTLIFLMGRFGRMIAMGNGIALPRPEEIPTMWRLGIGDWGLGIGDWRWEMGDGGF